MPAFFISRVASSQFLSQNFLGWVPLLPTARASQEAGPGALTVTHSQAHLLIWLYLQELNFRGDGGQSPGSDMVTSGEEESPTQKRQLPI